MRKNQLVIRLATDERRAIERLAERERLATSTLARKILLDEAARCGALQDDPAAVGYRASGGSHD